MKKVIIALLIALIALMSACVGTDEGSSAIPHIESGKQSNSTPSITRAEVFYTKEIEVDPGDLYSGIIKERCEKFRKMWETDPDFSDFSANGFDKYIKYFPDVYYSLIDLDGDDIDELVLGGWEKVGEYTEDPNPPRKIVITSAYAIKDGKAVKMDSGNWWNFGSFIQDRVLLSNGMILTTWGKEQSPNYSFIAYEGGELKLKCAVYLFRDNIYTKLTDVNGEEVQVGIEEFERLYAENIGDATPVEIEWKRIDQYGQ